MDNQEADKQKEQLPNKAELMQRISNSRTALEEMLNSLSQEQLNRSGSSGWSIKDHMAHLAAWELGIAELLRCRSRFAAMQVEEAVSQGKSEEEINDLIYHQHAALPLAEIRRKFRDAHSQLLAVLDELDDKDLLKPYASFADEGGTTQQRPVVNWIIGNTYAHFDEHLGYIQRTIKEIKAG
jgi:hypothetical protein